MASTNHRDVTLRDHRAIAMCDRSRSAESISHCDVPSRGLALVARRCYFSSSTRSCCCWCDSFRGFGLPPCRPSISLVARYFEKTRGGAFGIYNAIKGGGYVVAPAAGGVLAQQYGFAMIVVVSAAVGVLAFVLSLFLPADRGGTPVDNDEELSFKDALRIFTDARLLPIYAVIVVNMFLVGILFGFLPVYLHGIGYSTTGSGAVVSIATAAYLLIQPVAGLAADRYDTRMTVLVGLSVAAASIMATTFASGSTLIAIVIAAGVGIGTVWTNSDALVGAMAASNRLGASIGAAQSFKEFGDMVGPLAVGALTQLSGIRTGFVSCGIVAILLLIPLGRSQVLRASASH
jgi:DHA1 family multidrug resistance protein-like MFS transporter